MPTQCGYLAATRAEALRAPLGDLVLRHCGSCGHVWNSRFDPEKIGLEEAYDFSQYYSPSYRAYAASAVQRLKDRYGLEGKTAVDIGCGKGDFMRLLVGAGCARVYGYDPTFTEGQDSGADWEKITVYRKRFDGLEDSPEPDLITCRSVLQYIPQPRALLRLLRESLGSRHQTLLCFEVPNGAEAFCSRAVWYVMYEAGCFFSAASLARLFRECGFQVLEVLSALGGAHLEIEARPSVAPEPVPEESPDQVARSAREIGAFAAEYAAQVAAWSERFAQFSGSGKRVVLWGAGMRAVSFLVGVPLAAAQVEYVVDVNPLRQGRFLPKTGEQVIAPADLRAIRPDLVIATNPHYAEEIREQLESLELGCEFLILQ